MMRALLTLLALLVLAAPAVARTERIAVHGASIEGNLEGNSADRTVFVLLPPDYDSAKGRRYPVVYFLHGYLNSAEGVMKQARIEEAYAAAAGKGPAFILVVPDSYTRQGGSMYSNSVTVGNFEDFVARDLVAYVDSHYRTLARRESRGLAGHSMGGYGTLKLGMKHPDVFSALYAMNPCCLIPRPLTAEEGRKFETMDLETALKGDFPVRAYFAVAAAWSPNPGKPPFYADLGTHNGEIDPLVLAKWHANAPTAMIPQYVSALRSMTAIGLDTGTQDFVRADDEAMHAELQRFHLAHDWEIYEGDHGNRVPERLRAIVLPFFQKHLKAQ